MRRRRATIQWTMLINFRAPALLPGGKRPYRSYRIPPSPAVRTAAAGRCRSHWSIPRSSRTRSSFIGFTASGPDGRFRRRRSPTIRPDDARDPAPREHDRQHPREPIHPSGVVRVANRRGPDRRRSPSACCRRSSPFAAAAGTTAAILAGWTWFTVSAFKGGSWLNMVQPLAAGAHRSLCRNGLPVLRRRPRKAEGQETVRPLRLARRLRAAHRAPGAGRARR